ncbi:hypothetical protein GP486_005028 [Trichoglossum hirsutum]|uniref:Uncharacterized protein n=1 Tax=Trichoglossum hirsutum TaxID=265104 RepID=A0A9P8RMZ8_9PEZI|nr:hypothetical protein GP486_005028 [Trichoglossum hirsutum]
MVKKTALLALVLAFLAPLSVVAQTSSPTASSSAVITSTVPSNSAVPTNGDNGAGIGSSLPPGSAGESPSDGTPSSPQGGISAGASGSDNGFVHLSKGAEIAIIVIAVLVGGGGIASAVFYYIAKKRQWEVRKSIRRSATRLKNNLSSTNLSQKSARRQTGISKLQEPATPHGSKDRDLEKGNATPIIKIPKSPEAKAESQPLKVGEAVPGYGKKYGR